MKFAKVLEQTLIEEDIPQDWVEAAIQYKSLKKCISKVVKELQFLGLERNTLKLLLEHPSNEKVIELSEAEAVPTNPIIAQYMLTKSKDSSDIVPYLKITVNYDSDTFSHESIQELSHQLKDKIESMLNDSDQEHEHYIELKEEGEQLVLSPQTSRSRGGSPEPETNPNIDAVVGSSHKEEIVIMLNSDTKFFHMLDEELESLDRLKSQEESKLIEEVQQISDNVQTLADPKRRADMYKWRQLFRVYLDLEVFFRYNETEVKSGERNSQQIKQRLADFLLHVQKSGLTHEFKNKRSIAAFERFVALNFQLLKVLQFQSINSEAFRKILKKFDKQTSLGVKNTFPKLISDDHIFFSGASIAQSICYIMQSSVVTLIPQLEDYTCPICLSIAFKPIKLECGHRFCVRCLVKLKKQDKSNCPICRHAQAVVRADGSNLDMETMELMRRFFPLEVKEKLKDRDKERYDEVVGKGKCIVM